MSARPASSPDFPSIPPQIAAAEWCTLHRLIDELSQIQCRLGTPMELADDYTQVRELGHTIRNKLHLLALWQELGMTGPEPVAAESECVTMD